MQTAFQPLFLRPLHSPRMEVIAMKADIKEWDPEDPKKWDSDWLGPRSGSPPSR